MILFEIISTSLLVAVLSIPLAQGKLAMNGAYGIRIKKAFKSQENWNAINRYGGKQLIFWSVILFVICVPLVVFLRNNPLAMNLLAYEPLPYLSPVLQIYMYFYKLP